VIVPLVGTLADTNSVTRPVRRHRRSEPRSRGQGLVEFALVVPILAVLLMSILQVAMLLFAQVGLTNAAREAARNASSIPVTTAADAQTAADAYYARLTDATAGFLKRNVGAYSPTALVTTGSPRTQVCYYSFTDASGSPSIMAQVRVDYSHPLFIPLVSQILDGFDGTNDGGYRLGVSEEIRVGNINLTSAGGIGDNTTPVCNA
jgi:Flp pilus assembly protein TadG